MSVSFKFICPYYHHVAHIMMFVGKIKPSLEIHLQIWPAPTITRWNFCKNIEVLMTLHEKLFLLSATIFQFDKVFAKYTWRSPSKVKLQVYILQLQYKINSVTRIFHLLAYRVIFGSLILF